MANPISVALPADLPENWQTGQTVAPQGSDVGLTERHGYNYLMKQVAEEKRVAFLDLNPQFSGPDGQLPEDASGDGIHLRASYCKQWLEYLKTHTVSYEELYG